MVKNVNDPIPKWVERIRKGNIEFDSHVRLFIEEGITNMDAEDFQYLIKKYIDGWNFIFLKFTSKKLTFFSDKEVQKGLEDLYAKDENKAKAKSRLFKLVSHYGPPAADGDDINARALLSLVKIISRSNGKQNQFPYLHVLVFIN
jgi:hypothetical protein